MSNIQAILKQYWGYNSFRPLQEDIIRSVLSGKDTLALLPTGGGKSICFQVPAMAKDGLCLVISPLIALMKDQVENLRKKGITAFSIYSGMSRKEVINAFKVATESNCKFLYVSPERLETPLFKEYLPALDISLIAVDEAHCISQWGYDFRPPYLRIAALRQELPDVPLLALTASATPEVQQDIFAKLEFKQKIHFQQSFERPNLSYSVFKVDTKVNKIIDILQKVPGCSIVYCRSRRKTKEISDLLNMSDIKADYYHAGLTQDDRNKKQAQWINNEIRTIVCTNAFGMGIDKPDVRTVIHAGIPDCLENYYQEAGRAGRDGKRSYAVLLHDNKELKKLEQLPDTRFPSIENIRIVYQSIMNYLQIPEASGEGIYYEFDFIDFTNKFKLDSLLATHAIKALEQEGILSYNEQVFLPSKVQFTAGKSALNEFEQTHPQLEPLIKALLRAYEGIFDQSVGIQEKNLAFLLKKDPGNIIRELKILHAFSIIEYIPQKDTPQLYFMVNRVKTEDLHIHSGNYEKRKKAFAGRIQVISNYVQSTRQCRSTLIAAYFGDAFVKECGICDNCINRKKGPLSKEEFETIEQELIRSLQGKSLAAKDLLSQYSGIKKEKAWKVLEFLQAEQKLNVDQQGLISIR